MLKSILHGLMVLASVLFYSNAAMAAGAPKQLLIAAGDKQTTPAGTRVPGVVCVQVRDANNNPVPGINVTWGAVTGGGSLTNPVETTNSIGIATLGGWTLGSTAGINTTTATVPGTNSVTILS